MVERGMSCVKYLLFAFNLLFFLFGCVLIGLGAYAWISSNNYGSSGVSGPAIALVVVGVVTFVVAFFGCCGSIKENRCMVLTFSFLIGILLLIEIGIGIFAFVYKHEATKILEKGLNDTFASYQNDQAAADTWNFIQENLHCCGLNSRSDYGKIPIPSSCCASAKDCTFATAYPDGCVGKIEEEIKHGLVIVAGIAIGIGLIELIGIVLACCLAKAVRSEYEYL